MQLSFSFNVYFARSHVCAKGFPSSRLEGQIVEMVRNSQEETEQCSKKGSISGNASATRSSR